ncbi:MAG: hypothetical protein ACLQEQ_08560 [Nitrososphaerales archaeon]
MPGKQIRSHPPDYHQGVAAGLIGGPGRFAQALQGDWLRVDRHSQEMLEPPLGASKAGCTTYYHELRAVENIGLELPLMPSRR